MTKEDLINLKKHISELSEEEKKRRDLYLRELALGELQGPPTGYASIDKPWLKYYDIADINTDIPKMKAYDYLLLNNINNLNKTAISFLGKKITYSKLFAEIDRVAKAFVKLGVKKDDIVSVAIANTPENIYMMYALNRIGAIYNVVDPRLTPEEFKREISNVKSKYVVSLDMCANNILMIKEECGIDKIVCLNALESTPLLKNISALKNKNNSGIKNVIKWNQFLKMGETIIENIDSPFINNEPIVVVHTGGTTGDPKGVLLTNENFVSMAQMHKYGGLDYSINDKFLNILPPFVAFCLSNGINMPLTLGLDVILVPLFDVPTFPKLLDKYKPNHVLSGPILWEYTMKSDIKDLSYLKTPVSGGDSLNEATEIKINDYFKEKGCKFKVAQGYGMSEVSSTATFSIEKSNQIGSVGIPLIKNYVSIFDSDTCEEKKYGEEGEIWISSPTAMKEYINNSKATNELKFVDTDGKVWIRTGDIGKIDENGHLFIIGRMKRMIVRSGNKIFPSNVENLILENVPIDNCSIVSKHDEKERNVPIIHIIKSSDVNYCNEELVQMIENVIVNNLPDFNLPTQFIFRDSFPLTKLNKIDYKLLESEKNNEDKIIEIKEKSLIKKY